MADKTINLPNSEYWDLRNTRNIISGEKTALQIERGLKTSASISISNIRKEVHAFYGRYATDNKISLQDTRKRLSTSELKTFKEQSAQYIAEIKRLGNPALSNKYIGNLRRLSGQAYVTRMEELISNINYNVENISNRLDGALGDGMMDIYEDSFYRAKFDLDKSIGFGIDFTQPGRLQLERAVRANWIGDNYSSRIWQNKEKVIVELEKIIQQEFVRGHGSNVAAQKLVDIMKTNYDQDIKLSNAQRLIRTEVNHIANEGTMDAYRQSDGIVEFYLFTATLDNRTSEICRDMDNGKPIRVKDAKVGVNQPPLHPYCRSTTIPYFEDDIIGPAVNDRIARDKDGKTYKVGKDTTFGDWAKEHSDDAFVKRVKVQKSKFTPMDTFVDMGGFDKSLYKSYIKDDLEEEVSKFYYYKEIGPLNNYVGTSRSYDLNRHLYTGKYGSGGTEGLSGIKMDKEIDDLSALIKETSLPYDMKLVRYMDDGGLKGLMEKLGSKQTIFDYDDIRINPKNVSFDQLNIEMAQFIDTNTSGIIFNYNSFLSTSYDRRHNVFKYKPIQMNIYADKGSSALVTNNWSESEIIFDKGVRVEILETFYDTKKQKMNIDMRIFKD